MLKSSSCWSYNLVSHLKGGIPLITLYSCVLYSKAPLPSSIFDFWLKHYTPAVGLSVWSQNQCVLSGQTNFEKCLHCHVWNFWKSWDCKVWVHFNTCRSIERTLKWSGKTNKRATCISEHVSGGLNYRVSRLCNKTSWLQDILVFLSHK